MVQTNTIDSCLTKQLFRYGSGRRERSDDAPLLAVLTKGFAANGRHFDELLLDYVSHPTFAQKREPSLRTRHASSSTRPAVFAISSSRSGFCASRSSCV